MIKKTLNIIVLTIMLGCFDPGISYGDGNIYGPGGTSCAKWLIYRKEKTDFNRWVVLIRQSWIQGWLSAAGVYADGITVHKTDKDAMSAFIDNYCKAHPHSDLTDASVQLVNELSVKALKSR